MTDNRTTELLCKLLEEHGIEYTKSQDRFRTRFRFNYCETCGDYLNEIEVMGACITASKSYLTPEQAIAATLGSEREKRFEKLVRIYGEIANYFCERFACCDAEFANCKYCIGLPQGGQCELGWCNDESKALGIEQPDYGGGECEPVNLEELYDRIGELENERTTHSTLTAEQVRKAVERHGNIMDNRLYEDWQAVADELNAELGSGTCEWLPVESCHAFAGPGWECSNCGYEVGEYEHDFYNCCPICCAKVMDE